MSFYIGLWLQWGDLLHSLVFIESSWGTGGVFIMATTGIYGHECRNLNSGIQERYKKLERWFSPPGFYTKLKYQFWVDWPFKFSNVENYMEFLPYLHSKCTSASGLCKGVFFPWAHLFRASVSPWSGLSGRNGCLHWSCLINLIYSRQQWSVMESIRAQITLARLLKKESIGERWKNATWLKRRCLTERICFVPNCVCTGWCIFIELQSSLS